ncbi:DUF5050 domain-containing protein [Solibaculum mannosilyticum]|uniref:DUF5050 domain-containing protein n=1 Tax=Solibaculum mannosilyticum TaxID=2780922 RepID=UPI0007A8CB45|nr:hypothetical protein BN3661_02003 [Eubacteriaceae bacterium CHKCI005]
MKRRCFLSVLAIALVLLSASSCRGLSKGDNASSQVSSSGSSTAEPVKQENDSLETLNLSSNLKNLATVCSYGDRLYFVRNISRNTCLYSSNADGSDVQKIRKAEDNSVLSEQNFIVDDWIYFYGDSTSIFREKLDGTGRQELQCTSDDDMLVDWNIMFDDDYIYYSMGVNLGDLGNLENMDPSSNKVGGEFWRMTKDGKDHQKIYDQKLIDYVVQDGWVYFCNYDDDYHLYKMKADGTEVTQLTDTPAFVVQAEGDWIYYISTSSSEKQQILSRIKKDGTGQMDYSIDLPGLNIGYGSYNVSGNVIYFFDKSQNGSLYHMDADGSESEQLLAIDAIQEVAQREDYMISNLNILGDHIYFQVGPSDGMGGTLTYHCTTDGENFNMLEEEIYQQKE